MARLSVYIKGIYAGELEQKSLRDYVRYDEAYRTRVEISIYGNAGKGG